MNSRILHLAVPSILANITVPSWEWWTSASPAA